MRRVAAILVALVLGGCTVLRHDANVRGLFPSPESDAWARGIEVGEDWAAPSAPVEPFNSSTSQPFNPPTPEGGAE